MQRTRFSKILQNDFTDLPERIPGNHILQSHGNSVSRGDLITQENISVPDKWTLTINKDTYASLCQQATSWSQVGYYSGTTLSGSLSTDTDGIYVSNYGAYSGVHGPAFYAILPNEIGKSGQYWHLIYKFKTTFNTGSIIVAHVTAGFSQGLEYNDQAADDNDGAFFKSTFRNTSNSITDIELTVHPSVGSTNTYTFKFYHYPNNTVKVYINDTLYRNQSDPFVFDKGDNKVSCRLQAYQSYAIPYFRVQEITVSTDPTYDPQP